MGAVAEGCLELQPGGVHVLDNKVCRGVSNSAHAIPDGFNFSTMDAV